MRKFIKWIMERLYNGVPASWLSNKPSVYRDLTTDTAKEEKKVEVLLRYTVMHILDNNFEADPSELIVIFRNRYPDMLFEEFSMLTFRLGLIVAEFAMDRIAFYDAVKEIKDLPSKYDKTINEMTIQLALEEQAKKHIENMTKDTMKGTEIEEESLLDLTAKDNKISLKSMSTDELHTLLNELIGVIEKRTPYHDSEDKFDDKSKEE